MLIMGVSWSIKIFQFQLTREASISTKLNAQPLVPKDNFSSSYIHQKGSVCGPMSDVSGFEVNLDH